MAGKNLGYQKPNTKPASDSAPAGMKNLGVSPVRTIKGPSIKGGPTGPAGASYTDKGTSVISD